MEVENSSPAMQSATVSSVDSQTAVAAEYALGAKVVEGETVLLQFHDSNKYFAVVKEGEFMFYKKLKLPCRLLRDVSYGSVYDVTSACELELVASGQLMPDIDLERGSGADNRELGDTNTAQTLNQDDIKQMKMDGKGGKDIIDALIENSASFAAKTVFSQEKYIRKKQKKYMCRFRVMRPTVPLICDNLLETQPDKICGLRSDVLAQLLTGSNICAGGNVMVFDGVGGLLLGAVAERMGGAGTIVGAEPDFRVKTPTWVHAAKFNLGDMLAHEVGAPGLRVMSVSYTDLATWAHRSADIRGRILYPKPAAVAATTGNAAAGVKRKHDAISASEASHTAPTTATAPTPDSLDLDTAPPAKRRGVDAGSLDPSLTEGVTDAGAATAGADASADASADARATTVAVAATVAVGVVGGGEVAMGAGAQARWNKKAKAAADPARKHRFLALPLSAAEQQRSLMAGMDSIVIATPFHPVPLLLAALRFAKPSAAVAVYSTQMQPLAECYRTIKALDVGVCVMLQEIWYRPYQVLPERTHPEMSTNGAGGYLLTFRVIDNPYLVTFSSLLRPGDIAPTTATAAASSSNSSAEVVVSVAAEEAPLPSS